MDKGLISGKIFLALPDADKTVVAGQFTAPLIIPDPAAQAAQAAVRQARDRPVGRGRKSVQPAPPSMTSAKSSFLDKVLGRVGRLDAEGLQTVIHRFARERSFLRDTFQYHRGRRPGSG